MILKLQVTEVFLTLTFEDHHIGLKLGIVYNIIVNNLLGSIEIGSKSYDKTSFIIKKEI